MAKTANSRKRAVKRIQELRSQIVFHEKKYYVDNDPQISDYEFDLLLQRLEQLEKTFPDLITSDSPTQRVGEQPLEGFTTVAHSRPMLSLDNSFSSEELRDFEDRIRRLLPGENLDYVAELKIDGLGISVFYREGSFAQAVTRGDGLQGDDVTANVRTIRSFPMRITGAQVVEVRGEIYLPYASFQKINKQREERGEPFFANPRNAAAGSIRLLDPKEVAARRLDVFLYSIFINGREPDSQWESLESLRALGFKTNPVSRLCSGLDEVIAFYEEWQRKRDTLDYDVDGIVIKVNRTDQRERLGSTAKFPRWAISYKFPARQATTLIKDIRIQVGRTGALTPVAILEPVKLSGITISRSTLHNEDEIQRKDIRIGDHVLIERSGDVIPKVVSAVKERRTGEEKRFIFPKTCPVCGSAAFRPKEEAVSRCTNSSCPAKLRESLLHFASRRAMDIEGLGAALVDQLLAKKLVTSLPDIYTLKRKDLENLARMGIKSSQNLLDEIEKSKSRDLSRLIFALGIRHVGEHTAQALASHAVDLDKLAAASFEELTQVEDVGPKVAESIVFFFLQPENRAILERLKKAGLNFRISVTETPRRGRLSGQIFVLTGKLEALSRGEAKQRIENLGGTVVDSVSGRTSMVVVGESPGSKLKRAQALGITTMEEAEFLNLLED